MVISPKETNEDRAGTKDHHDGFHFHVDLHPSRYSLARSSNSPRSHDLGMVFASVSNRGDWHSLEDPSGLESQAENS
jgi:hypothetical protein